MATKPTPGGSDGTYGTEMNAFLDVSLADDGKVKDGAVFSTSAAPSVDAGVANKLYVDNGGERLVGGAATVVHTLYLTGTTDADSQTLVAHGIASALTKILHVSTALSTGSAFFLFDLGAASPGANRIYTARWNATNVVIDDVGTDFQSQAYVIKIDYID